MTVARTASRFAGAARIENAKTNLCHRLASISIQQRPFSYTTTLSAVKPLHAPSEPAKSTSSRPTNTALANTGDVIQPAYVDMTPAQRAARAAERARAVLKEQQDKYSTSRKLGGLADNSFFAEKEVETPTAEEQSQQTNVPKSLDQRALENMSFAINPKPDTRARWQRKMLIRNIRHRGRLTRQVQIARTERSHLSQSHFFKTSVKKLAPLARQIAGKSIDEAILQMRFSKKKATKEIRSHLIQARDEAVVVKGMGLGAVESDTTFHDSPAVLDPAITPPLPHQNPTKSTKPEFEKSPTDMYVAEAWVNRGPYGMEPEFRARGRVNYLRPPWTGISVLLKEEKTRTRQKADKEAKAIKKRTGKNMWLQLPDRPITRQSQHVLW